MNALEERRRSLWMETPLPRPAALAGDAETDVLVVGAGISGLSAAYELALQGRSVLVLDRGGIGGGMTLRTSAARKPRRTISRANRRRSTASKRLRVAKPSLAISRGSTR